MLTGQFAIGIYGGYFGGAVGLMMMALWALAGEFELRNLNPPRAMLATAANTAAVVTFIVAGAVRWPPTLIMLVGGTLGSYIGARIGRSLSPINSARCNFVLCLPYHYCILRPSLLAR
jgi:uncharacterized membrane protein YfcA